MATEIGKLAEAAMGAVRSQESSTRESISSDLVSQKRHFLQVFRRWEALFKRADRGDETSEKWLIAEYYKSLQRLSPAGLEALTEKLKERCIFFPTVKECLDIVNISEHSYEWGNPFRNKTGAMYLEAPKQPLLSGRPIQQVSLNAPISDEPDIIEDPIND